jgi:hypothetical protein
MRTFDKPTGRLNRDGKIGKRTINTRHFPGEKAIFLRPDRARIRREVAITRQVAFNALTLEQKMLKVSRAPGFSEREISRLL